MLFYLSPERAEYSGLRGAPGYVYCERVLDRWSALLERWAPSIEDCPVNPLRLEFDQNVSLGETESYACQKTCCVWRLPSAVLMITFLKYHSLAVHVIDVNSGDRVAQGDVGVGLGTFFRLASEIDISTLSPGDYEAAGRALQLEDWRAPQRS